MSSLYRPITYSSTSFLALRAIDGSSKTSESSLNLTNCAVTKRSMNPWLRVDLKKQYLVSSGTVSFAYFSGEDLHVHVGNSLTNNGNDNQNCDLARNDGSNNGQKISKAFRCSSPVWGRYINLQRLVTNHFLVVCEVVLNYGLFIHRLDVEYRLNCFVV